MLLVVNAGSSSIKLAVFDAALTEVATARITEIGQAVPDHRTALDLGLGALHDQGLALGVFRAAAHRVVHGGADLTESCRLTPATIAAIAACTPLAPLHNPANLTAIAALADLAPDLAQYASFDTAFHATNPAVATAYALPAAEHALRRYGFHGLSYAGLVHQITPLPRRLLALHLGNGASACAILDGKSVATTMGYSPLDGLTMGTRAGSIDGNAVLDLAARHGIDGAARIVNRESGLLGLGGHSDMRALHTAGTDAAQFAVAHFCYWAIRHAGSLIAAMGGLDGVAFTGGIGENDVLVRGRILDGLGWAGVGYDRHANAKGLMQVHLSTAPVAIWIVPAREERQIAMEATAVITRERLG